MAKEIFDQAQEDRILGAIRAAERLTSGEIKVHVEHKCPTPDPLARAQEVFGLLDLHQTKLRNGVLFYLATEDRRFAIWSGAGIHTLLPDQFWQNIQDTMRSYFRQGQVVEGLCEGVRMAGEQLRDHFPRAQDDTNELSDEISLGS